MATRSNIISVLIPTLTLIPLGFSFSSVINILCKSIELAPTLPLFSHTLVFLVGISLSVPAVALSLLINCAGMTSSELVWFLETLTALNGDGVGPDCSGGDGRGDDECLPLAVVVEDIPDLYADFGGPPETSLG